MNRAIRLIVEELMMSRYRLLTLLLCGSVVLLLEFAAAAPPEAGTAKSTKGTAAKSDKGEKSADTRKTPKSDKQAAADADSKPEKVVKTEAEWRKILTPMQFKVTRKKFTEQSGSNPLVKNHKDGVYHCVCCGEPLFDSKTKFESGTGWPSFFQPLKAEGIAELEDTSENAVRTEVQCSRCDAHLGHVFADGPQPTGLRYCINGASLKFVDRKKEQAGKDKDAKPAKTTRSAKTEQGKEATD